MLPRGRLRLPSVTVIIASFALLVYYSFTGPSWQLPLPLPHATFQTSRCPSPIAPLPPFPRRDEQTCRPLPLQDPTFTASLCTSPSACNAFTLSLRRSDPSTCPNPEEWDVSSLASVDTWAKYTLGPDSFLIRTDGAERGMWATPDRFDSVACGYEWDIQLSNAGPAWVQAWFEFPNYLAVIENNASWPEVVHAQLFAEPVQLPPCSAECTPYRASITTGLVELSPPPLVSLDTLPPCSGPDPIRGAYIPIRPILELADLPITPGQMLGAYAFVPHTCRYAHGLRYSSPERCTRRPMKIFATGDSHGRVAHDALLHRLKGGWTTLTESEKMGEKTDSAGLVQSRFVWDPVGALEPDKVCAEVREADVVLLSLGMWFSAAEGTRTAEALERIQYFLHLISSCPHRPEGQRLIYLNMPAHPPRSDHFVREKRDHVTNARMELWSSLAEPVAREEGWAAVDQFGLTTPYVLETMGLDSAHFTGTEALDAVVDEMIEKGGFCE